MYKMAHFTEPDRDKVIAFMKANSFALVTGTGNEYPVASHLPLDITEENGKLFFTGHLMRKTDHHLAFEQNNHVLVVFSSAHAVINAGWYEDPAQAGTVNYMAVHAKGKITFTGEAGAYEAIKQITEKYTGANNPASFDNIPDDYIRSNLKAIVGFRIEVESIDNVFKLSQNKNEADRHHIIRQLEERNEYPSAIIAGEMKQRLP